MCSCDGMEQFSGMGSYDRTLMVCNQRTGGRLEC